MRQRTVLIHRMLWVFALLLPYGDLLLIMTNFFGVLESQQSSCKFTQCVHLSIYMHETAPKPMDGFL
jgi:hypothetical protein